MHASRLPTPSRSIAELGGPALRTFFRIADAWGLKTKDEMILLGGPPPSTFFQWKKQRNGALTRDVVERISHVIGIYKALAILFPQTDRADDWIRRPNTAPLFAGRCALDRMLSGNVSDLFVVRSYLDAQRGG